MDSTFDYNTTRSKMQIPEYGRNVQKMVDHAVSVEDKEERNKVARAIIAIMGQLNPHLRDVEDFTHKLWAHLFIMSDFKLDVDSPYPLPKPENFETKPDSLEYPDKRIKYDHYGKTIELLIAKAKEYKEGDEKEVLIKTIANLMKRSYLTWNRDTVNDEVIAEHLKKMSGGELILKDPSVLMATSDIMKSRKRKGRVSKSSGRSNKSNNYRRNKKR